MNTACHSYTATLQTDSYLMVCVCCAPLQTDSGKIEKWSTILPNGGDLFQVIVVVFYNTHQQ